MIIKIKIIHKTHVVAKVKLVPCFVNLTGKRDKVAHGEVTINNARIILKITV